MSYREELAARHLNSSSMYDVREYLRVVEQHVNTTMLNNSNTSASEESARNTLGFWAWRSVIEGEEERNKIQMHQYWHSLTSSAEADVVTGIRNAMHISLRAASQLQNLDSIELIGLRVKNGTVFEHAQKYLETLITSGELVEIPVRPLLTVHPSHKAALYKFVNDMALPTATTFNLSTSTKEKAVYQECHKYIYMTNVISDPEVYLRLSTAVANNYLPIMIEKELPNAAELLTMMNTEDYTAIFAILLKRAEEKARAIIEARKQQALNRLSELDFSAEESQNIRQTIQSLQNRINDYEESVRRTYVDLEDQNRRLFSLTQGPKTNPLKDAIEFLRTCETVYGVTLMDNMSRLGICVYGPMQGMDVDPIKAMIESRRMDNIYHSQPEWMRDLIRHVYITQDVKIFFKTTAKMRLRPNEDKTLSYGETTNAYAYDRDSYNRLAGIPNTHHQVHNCWGTYEQEISTVLRNNDYITAVAMLVACMTQINTSDSVVLSRFFSDVRQNTTNILEVNGIKMSPDEYARKYQEGTLWPATILEPVDAGDPIPEVEQPQPRRPRRPDAPVPQEIQDAVAEAEAITGTDPVPDELRF